MERLTFELESPGAPAQRAAPVVVGVVASGNLEVLVEGTAPPGRCHVEVATSAVGFGEIWRAVLEDFAALHAVGGLALSVNDAGATPAVVTLRLGQAVEEWLGKAG
ncbi:malonate decarboxylase acyl carrier protein [Anaeromyxobacter oryzae]|uniref:Malonate decarboxylase acyl carrier protein n=1 Tax=Anaeromyxobacter oryzae TaxID=2918170 RepID=A0ABM7X124_9BACT|nr:malonate decarboxylase acyl carrier protein [Anaeromyxobacter oryzae]BDG05497.1 malonate decarboxylase acyl carrier protein [Anaeromyxobacter oryzae]